MPETTDHALWGCSMLKVWWRDCGKLQMLDLCLKMVPFGRLGPLVFSEPKLVKWSSIRL
ncbi:hypothetical protein Dsin_016239 [Dipteronia sinensis]|uniref:Uncharacterized protein n=1 Tax=Dipteronia sinensis TaxID=43782 RepID=A0AAE0ADH5_9ROSI|nr:hypothetical protein Dsin_016239 [Dipteronia sinensis]